MKFRLNILILVTVSTMGLLNILAAEETATIEEAGVEKVLGVGSLAPTLEGVTWIQGEEVKRLDEKGKLYIVECWATWCGPCIEIMPHMDDLHQTYVDRGLVIVGMNVWEEGIENAQQFLKNKGDKMAYKVAYSGGRKSKFSNSWLTASKTEGIPQSFVVRDGKIIFIGHPADLKKEMIELMLTDTFHADEVAKLQKEQDVEMARIANLAQTFYEEKNWKELKKLSNHPLLKGTAGVANAISVSNAMMGDWKAQLVLLEEIQAGEYEQGLKLTDVFKEDILSAKESDAFTEFAKKIEALYVSEMAPTLYEYDARLSCARVLFLAGKVDKAYEFIAKLKEDVKKAISANIKTIEIGKAYKEGDPEKTKKQLARLAESLKATKTYLSKLEELDKKMKEGEFPVFPLFLDVK